MTVTAILCIYFIFFRWYFGRIKRIEAEKKLLLPENEHGAFLIRDSESRRNDYSLSGESLMNHFSSSLFPSTPYIMCSFHQPLILGVLA